MTPSSERSIKGLLNAFSWAGSGSVKGACGMVMCGGEGIHLPLTGSGQHLPWRLWPLMGHHRKLLITFLNNAYFIRVKTNELRNLQKLTKEKAENFESTFCGWQAKHKFRCKTKGGSFDLPNYLYLFDTDLKKITYQENMEDEDLKNLRELIDEALKDNPENE